LTSALSPLAHSQKEAIMSFQDNIIGKVVVITDASSAVGEATARLLARRGAMLVLAARRKNRLDSLVDDLRSEGARFAVFTIDVSRKGDVDALAEGALREFGRIDVLVNNAGSTAPTLEGQKAEDPDQACDVNIKGVLYGIAAVLPSMRERGSGHVINLSSGAVFRATEPIGTVYGATKFAVRAISDGLRIEARAGIRSTVISRGVVESECEHNSRDNATPIGARALYDTIRIPAGTVARTIVNAIERPADADDNEIVAGCIPRHADGLSALPGAIEVALPIFECPEGPTCHSSMSSSPATAPRANRRLR
jgi:NADP-dependent 3-hydroxy acid dehydrogenase YdfG